jgi:hypothetical protein
MLYMEKCMHMLLLDNHALLCLLVIYFGLS